MAQFLHHDADFRDLLDTVAQRSPLKAVAMVEKDYWIVHTLWGLQQVGLPFQFKGGTSLSKAYGLTQRFSEDIDLIVDHTAWPAAAQNPLPSVDADKWHSSGKQAIAQRKSFWTEMVQRLNVPDVLLELDHTADEDYRNIKVVATYPGHHVATFAAPASAIKPFVLVELTYTAPGRGAAPPSIQRAVTSYTHGYVATTGVFAANPSLNTSLERVSCVHPLVTLLEKLDAITKRYARDTHFDASAFTRHYGDAACIIRQIAQCEALPYSLPELHRQMLDAKQLRRHVTDKDPAFLLTDPEKASKVRAAHDALSPMFWAEQMTLDEAIDTIREWLAGAPVGQPT